MTDIQLDSKNITRLTKIFFYRIKKNRMIIAKRFFAYFYLFAGFCFFSLYFSYNIRIAVKPLGYFLILTMAVGLFLLYVLINHLIIRRAVSHKILLIFDFIVFILLICIFISDYWIESSHYQ